VRSAGRLQATYAASGSVVPIATNRPMRAARRSASRAQLAQRPPMTIPATNSPHPAQGCLGPTGHGAGELVGRSTAP
jgi:hypothetical protein